ncbi:hypothetical protein [Geitlerinema sp. PCC 7407]|uniref:hypothetical protein n=1 Tax=Geitlerinema sp. PCC 7407 TaxID=1173025 RepID=UPI00029F97AA|nr:hypothetical protein [Geitlerinema sp. PCC 7407]AFY65236.1 hypothetical protein GEI7407_0738 [Geitlerinema sp. PCC 7407]
MLHDYPLLAISESKRSGLILFKGFHAEFAGPGAAVGSGIEAGTTRVIAIGRLELCPVTTVAERQEAYSKRIQWMRWLRKISDHADPVQRSEKLLVCLEAFFGARTVASLPTDALAALVGVFPETMQRARQRYPGWLQPEGVKIGEENLSIRWLQDSAIAVANRPPGKLVEEYSVGQLGDFFRPPVALTCAQPFALPQSA